MDSKNKKMTEEANLILKSLSFWRNLVVEALIKAEKAKNNPEELKKIEAEVLLLVGRSNSELRNIDRFLKKVKK